ncbi:MAG TPA: DUF3053 family protein [Stellaceae bacterium]|jgi:hypothetical protein|nr:DUF3053 family protein [Stellaceae bacterium]
MGFRGKAMRVGCFALLALFVAGCNDEPAQRKAFIGFLQTRILDKPGLHVPHLTQDEAKSFGPYAQHYAIITEFNDGLDRSVAVPMQEAISRGAIHSIDEVVTRHADFIAARDGIAQLRAAIDKQLTAADAAHAALKQPDDLKPVFDKAYERDVTIPAKAFADIFPDLSQALTAIVDLGDFLEQHKDTVSINGTALQTTDRALQPRLQALVDALIAKNEAIAKAQQNLRTVLNGS